MLSIEHPEKGYLICGKLVDNSVDSGEKILKTPQAFGYKGLLGFLGG